MQDKIPNTAYVEVDKIRGFIGWMKNKEAWDTSFDIALIVAKEFLKRKLNIIITYVISDDRYEFLVRELSPLDPEIYAFTLRPRFESLLDEKNRRSLTEWEKKRIKETYEAEKYNVSYGTTLDNSDQKPEETAKFILNKIQIENTVV